MPYIELYVAVPLLSLVGSGIGAYFAPYLRKKGENLATHEDIGKLVDQVAAVTETTKEIEARISDEVWGRQRLWEMKRDAYFALMKAESAAAEALLGFMSGWDTVKDQHPDNQAALNFKEEMYGSLVGSWRCIRLGASPSFACVQSRGGQANCCARHTL